MNFGMKDEKLRMSKNKCKKSRDNDGKWKIEKNIT